MKIIFSVKYAFLALSTSLLMGLVTVVHHLHSGLILNPGGPELHVVWNEAFIMPMTVLTMLIFLRTNSKIALWGYLTIAVVGFIGLGLYEGGWNHSLKILGYLRIGSPEVDITNILPLNNIDLWFYEITGVLTFVIALVATYYNYKFWRVVVNKKISNPILN